ncbi:G2/mitotic-specific cyclin (Clb3), putative [Metarhizium acridum CQMa 102]|uniref:G2/mitotic-specific cyclin (Clb3), putative n=1 Tax=Metarhizium acridum (strain CQMa 102) TaxID=655827 RepID=E9DS94_METAQ|nr:G2/mitotic-specific cyclin (Clb3), putative [Metarhizium acridum CQMa 102]EFY93254.1 G2/mitotic-specific cyclin (Clb3), putative [Metarhizium acridum CQMa 102]
MAAGAAAAVGFRGPAKRAAFGDVTNMSKNTVGSRDDAKMAKLQTVTGVSTAALINKENAPYYVNGKDSFARPAQRLSNGLSSKPKVLVAPDTGKKSTTSAVPELAAIASTAVVASNPRPAGVARPRAAHESDREVILPSFRGSFDVPPLQPRHHKSQPQLKQQNQPTLRRTQSKQFERADFASGKAARSSGPDLVGMPSRIVEEQTCADLPYTVAPRQPIEEVNHAASEEYVELAPSKPSHITEEPQHIPIPSRESHTQVLSEAEEYWDEDEDEDYDDQDQAYTTAHSFRSQNLTTGGVTTILAPRLTSKIQRELEEARLEVQQTRSLNDIEEEMWDVSMVAEYGEEIFEYLRELETEIQWSMRSVLMDWLVQVHNRFSLLPETLFLTVNYIDRFLSCKIVSIGKLQLVGATAILIASKYEEINCPSLEEIVYMVDRGYSPEEILKAERFMLSMLSFELGWPGPMSFLRRVSKADDYDLDTRTLAKYFLELTIMDERFVASPPSFLAAGAHCLSRLILKKGDWTKAHVHYSGYTWAQLKPLVTMMIECCEQPALHHSAVYEKYQEKRFKEAATVVQHALDAGFTLPHHSAPIRPVRGQTDDLSDMLPYSNSLLVSTEG